MKNLDESQEELGDALVALGVALEKAILFLDPEAGRERRQKAAEEVCDTVLLMMHLGLLEIPKEDRLLLAHPMIAWNHMHFAERGLEQ